MACTAHLLLLAPLLLALTRAEGTEGNCTCGVFPMPAAASIIEYTLRYTVTCDEEGAEQCQKLCVALAETVGDKAPAMICEKLNSHVENLKVGVYTKSCGAGAWSFTGMRTTDPICCHEGKSRRCAESTSVATK